MGAGRYIDGGEGVYKGAWGGCGDAEEGDYWEGEGVVSREVCEGGGVGVGFGGWNLDFEFEWEAKKRSGMSCGLVEVWDCSTSWT